MSSQTTEIVPIPKYPRGKKDVVVKFLKTLWGNYPDLFATLQTRSELLGWKTIPELRRVYAQMVECLVIHNATIDTIDVRID